MPALSIKRKYNPLKTLKETKNNTDSKNYPSQHTSIKNQKRKQVSQVKTKENQKSN